jgi:hypothetical protein
MTHIKAQVVLPYYSALPEDVTSNTFHFFVPTTPATSAELGEIVNRLDAFYHGFDDRLAAVISRTNGAEVRLYDMADPEPRQPLDPPWGFLIDAAAGGTNLPNELSLVLSFHSAFVSGVPNARRRGRVYLGPFTSTQSDPGSNTAFSRPSATLVSAVAAAAPLLNTQIAEPLDWAQYSPTNDALLPVVGGWVDNEWDIQRRRGVTATARTTFTA